jgi:hypothetical protein
MVSRALCCVFEGLRSWLKALLDAFDAVKQKTCARLTGNAFGFERTNMFIARPQQFESGNPPIYTFAPEPQLARKVVQRASTEQIVHVSWTLWNQPRCRSSFQVVLGQGMAVAAGRSAETRGMVANVHFNKGIVGFYSLSETFPEANRSK